MSEAIRRANGDAKITRDPDDGRWYVFLELPPGPNGERRRKRIWGKTRKAVVDKRKEVEAELARGGTGGHERITVAQVVELYLDHRKGKVADETLANYRHIAKHVTQSTLGKKPVAKLTPLDVERLILAKQQTHSARTVKLIRTIIGAALSWAEQRGIVARNVVRYTEGPRIGQTTHRAMTEEQAKKVLAAAKTKKNRHEGVYALMLSLGLRPGECLGLQWEDLDLESEPGWLTVRHGLKRGGTLGEVKNDGSRRRLPIPAGVVPILIDRREVQELERRYADEYWQPGDLDLVFTTKYGTPVNDRNLARDFRALCKSVNVGVWDLHECRHTAATVALLNGVPIEFVSKMLGHSDIRQTANTYSHIRPRHLESVAEKIDGVLFGA